jgi:hypothetical protein
VKDQNAVVENRDRGEPAVSARHWTVGRVQQPKLQSVDAHAGERCVGGYRAHDCEALIVMAAICMSESCQAISLNKHFVIVKSVVIIQKAGLRIRMDFTSLCSTVR